jgi:hypothetical protein
VNDTLKSKLKSLPRDETLRERPAHALLERLEARQRRARHRDQRHVTLGEMNEGAVDPSSQPGPNMKW